MIVGVAAYALNVLLLKDVLDKINIYNAQGHVWTIAQQAKMIVFLRTSATK